LKALEALKYHERHSIEDVHESRRLAEETLSVCPENVLAICVLGYTHLLDCRFGTTKSAKESFEKAMELAQKAIALDDGYAWGHALLASLYGIKREYDKAIYEQERALALSPSSADMHVTYGNALAFAGRPVEAIPFIKKAIRLNPYCPSYYFPIFANACRCAGEFEEGIAAAKRAIQLSPDNFLAHLNLTAMYSMMGREKEAHAEAAELLRMNPNFSLDNAAKAYPNKDQSVTNNFLNALAKAGLK
jgi:adenylate cyclase